MEKNEKYLRLRSTAVNLIKFDINLQGLNISQLLDKAYDLGFSDGKYFSEEVDNKSISQRMNEIVSVKECGVPATANEIYVKDVHTEHCCKCSCKYNDEDCTVITGQKPQSYPCNADWY